jgi:5-(carboxyamino)imidazole ribonucleotide mutase
VDGALNAAILATQMIGTGDDTIYQKTVAYKSNLKTKMVKANEELASYKYKFRTI